MKPHNAHTRNKTRSNSARHVLLLFFVVALFLISTLSVNALARPRLVVSGFSTDGTNAMVGSDFDLLVNLTNVDVVCAMTTIASVTTNEPFVSRGTNTALPVDVCGGETKTVRIPLHVESTAVGGSYQLPLALNFEDTLNTPYSSTDVLTVFVSGTPNIRAHVSSSTPIDIYAGDTATLTVTLENAGTFVAQSLNATLSASAPLDVKWTKSFASIGSLAAGKTTNVAFALELPKKAQATAYPMQLHVEYLDENRNVQKTDIALQLTMKSKALFTVSTPTKNYLYTNDNQKVMNTVFKNTGTDTAYNIRIMAQPQYPFTTDGSVRFIKSLAPGESAPVDLVFNVDKDGTVGAYGLDLLVNFEDLDGKSLQDTAKIEISVAPKGFLRAVFIDYWFVWLVAIVVGFIVRRKKIQKAKLASKK